MTPTSEETVRAWIEDGTPVVRVFTECCPLAKGWRQIASVYVVPKVGPVLVATRGSIVTEDVRGADGRMSLGVPRRSTFGEEMGVPVPTAGDVPAECPECRQPLVIDADDVRDAIRGRKQSVMAATAPHRP